MTTYLLKYWILVHSNCLLAHSNCNFPPTRIDFEPERNVWLDPELALLDECFKRV